VRCDRDLLRAFAAEADTVEAYQDPKLAAAVEELAAIAAQAELLMLPAGARRSTSYITAASTSRPAAEVVT